MQIGFIGLGKMGANMVLRLTVGSTDGSVKGGHAVVGYDLHPNPDLAEVSAFKAAESVEALVGALSPPRVVWVMVPAGNPTENVIKQLAELLGKGDVVIDGGNSFYKDSLRRARALGEKGIGFLDVGTSGGIWGRSEGYCMMVGGTEADARLLTPILDTLAPENGWAHVGAHGAGHFVKMIHNGIEYGLMQAYGEGFEILRKSQFELNLHQVADVWQHGSVIRSWLLSLGERMLREDATLETIQPYVEDSGEGRWTVQAAIEEAVAAPVIAASLFARFDSRDTDDNFSARFCAALRKQFGGHDVITKDVTTKTAHRKM
jgi:6-phosphogluconate dehydrogenase